MQLDYAVDNYVNVKNILSFIRNNEVQTALGIALVVDRAIQAGAEGAHKTIMKFAKDAGIPLPFTGAAQEKRLAEYIVGKAKTSDDHKRRVKLLLEDKYRLLTVNLYDWNTYGAGYDN
jgi:hypothetical protein